MTKKVVVETATDLAAANIIEFCATTDEDYKDFQQQLEACTSSIVVCDSVASG